MSVTHDLDDEIVPGLRPDGTPDPDYAARLGLVAATPLRRSLAFATDAAVWIALSIPGLIAGVQLVSLSGELANGKVSAVTHALSGIAIPALISLAATTVFGLVQLLLHGMRGITVGKAIAGIRSVNVARFTAPGFWRVLLRVLVLYASQLVLPLIGPAVLFASSFWDDEHRGRSWLDRIGRTWVVRTRGGLDPFDTRAMRQAKRALDAPVRTAATPLPSLATGAGATPFAPGPRLPAGVIGAAATDAAADDWQPPAFSGADARTDSAPVAPSANPPAAEVATPGSPAVEARERRTAVAPARTATTATTATPITAATLTFDDGTRLRVSGDGVMGRNPEARAGERIRHAIPVDDPSMRISKTHVSFGIDAQGFWVSDRGSTNGTLLATVGDEPHEIVAGERVHVPWGASVQIGGRSFSVAPAEGDA
ncbi:RDD family protein [Rathayibacter sp. YIM 133350]|uniref:RDD family protein n=1 Tax=Rathayibacter sp. YIM 133350 TaxID=3131992 RepID=UPI00307DD905